MIAEKFLADSASEVGLNPDKVQALMDRAERDVKDGVLPACQVAIARNGKLAAMNQQLHCVLRSAEVFGCLRNGEEALRGGVWRGVLIYPPLQAGRKRFKVLIQR